MERPDLETLDLVAGWNFVSVPHPLAPGFDTAAIFSDVNTGGYPILLFDSVEQTYVPMETEDQVLPLDGMWIYAVAPASVPLPSTTTRPRRCGRKRWFPAGTRSAFPSGSTPALRGALFGEGPPELSGGLRRRNTEK